MATTSVAQLLQHLGGESFALARSANGEGESYHVGTLGGLPVSTLAGDPAAALLQARRAARRGSIGVMIGHDQATGRWLITVTIQPVRLTIVAVGDLAALPLRRLQLALNTARSSSLQQAVALADALDVDAAGRRTFRLLHKLLERAIGHLPSRVPRDDRHAWSLAQITRLLFLRFVESEGWLDGNPRFLAESFDRCLIARRDPTRHLLHPLFFGTLNCPVSQRSRFARGFGDIPFLNGGLFESHPVERRYALRLPVEYWRDLFGALVDRVDVTLDAQSDQGRVTPELLGRVFEGVMHPAERRAEGAFFTPPALVDALLRQAISCHLAPKLGRTEAAIDNALDDPDPSLQRTLLDVTVLDPAVGSGAFLVGALGLLHGPGARRPARVHHLVTRRLHGVDRHPGAVRLCELRLWLEVLRSLRGRHPEMLPPLPNLDSMVRAGDALIDPLFGAGIDSSAARRLRLSHRAILGAHGKAKRAAIADSRRIERATLLGALQEQELAIDAGIADLLAAARASTLFGDRPVISPSVRRALAVQRTRRTQCRAEQRRITRDLSSTPFAIGAAFGAIMAGRGGFDLVVGNPPWVRAEALPEATRHALAARYRWWRSSGSGWRHLPDLSVAFAERGFTLLANGGTLALLVPAKLATAGYAQACRSDLVSRATIHRVADLGADPRAGFEATTYPLGIVASRRPAPPGHMIHLGLECDAPAQAQSAWPEGAAWLTASPGAQRVAMRMAREHPPLSEFVIPQIGVKTGANDLFLNPPEALHAWCRPALRGRDLRPFAVTSDTLLLWPADRRGVPWRRLPEPLIEYLTPQMMRLQQRADQHRGPWWQLFRTTAATAPHRVVWRDLAPTLHAAAIDDADMVPLNSCYVASVASPAIADALSAWLNAAPIRAIARMRAEPAAGGCARFAARTVGAVPLPPDVLGDRTLASLSRLPDAKARQQAIDDHVLGVLGISSTERDALIGVAADRC